MKRFFILAISLFVSATMLLAMDPPARNQWSSDNCKDAGVTTTTNNDYYDNGYKSQVKVQRQENNNSKVETRTTVRDYSGNVVDEISNRNWDGSLERSVERGYKRDVTSSTECRWRD